MLKENPVLTQVNLVLKHIKTVRVINGISQYEMANRLNISQNSYFKIEKGVTKLDLYRLIEISQILKINISNLFLENEYSDTLIKS
jgi:DNA-binding XRE family transcriptional regulator